MYMQRKRKTTQRWREKKAQINLSRGLIFIIYILGQYMIIMITTKCKLQ